MLFELLKYDIRAMWKKLSLVWGAALVLALATRFTLFVPKITYYERVINGKVYGGPVESNSGAMGNLFLLTFGAVLVAMFVIVLMFVIQRFSKGLLGDEGYLMHTLPVRPWQLVASKLICSVAAWTVSGLAALLSMVLMTPVDLFDVLGFQMFYQIFRGMVKHPDMLVLVLEFCLFMVSCMVVNIAAMYLAMSVGHLFPRFRGLISVAAFIGLYILLISIYERVFANRLVSALMNAASVNVHGSILTSTAIMLLPAFLFLAAVCWILEHKLNLE